MQKKILLIGGGHTHLLFLLRFAAQASESRSREARVTLISPGVSTAYSGMFTGLLNGTYEKSDTMVDLKQVCSRTGCTFISGAAESIDFQSKMVSFRAKEDHKLKTSTYDVLSIDIGARPKVGEIFGAEEFGHPVKPVDEYHSAVHAGLFNLNRPDLTFVQVGCGAAGIEVACAIAGRLRSRQRAFKLYLIDSGHALLPKSPPALSRMLERHLVGKYSAEIRLDSEVEALFPLSLSQGALKTTNEMIARTASPARVPSVRPRHLVQLKSGEVIASDFTTFATAPRPPNLVDQLAIEKTSNGFIKVNEFLETSIPGVFACGDVALNPDMPCERAGVFAVRQAPALFQNIAANLRGEKSTAVFKPQKNWLSLMIDGDGRAFGHRGELVLPHSRWTLWLKDKIDRSFMRNFESEA